MRLIYPGPSAAVTLLATGQTAERGVPIDIPDVDVGLSLVAQGWTPAPKPRKKKAADKAAPDTDTAPEADTADTDKDSTP